jgi:hypothetical protein
MYGHKGAGLDICHASVDVFSTVHVKLIITAVSSIPTRLLARVLLLLSQLVLSIGV